MNNENQNPGMELNEAALEGVSGGYDPEQRALEIANATCMECKRIGVQNCGGAGPKDLARAILSSESNMESGSFDFRYCPLMIGSAG